LPLSTSSSDRARFGHPARTETRPPRRRPRVSMMRKIAIVAAPLFLLMVLETAFRLGIWEPLAASRSHAAASIRVKRALLDPALARIDFVTLGSSRPQFGIDHARLADAAAAQGFVHANLS